jgi:CBS domain-containing protein
VRCPSCGADNIAGNELCDNCGSDLAGLDLPEARGGAVGRLMTDTIGDHIELTPPITARPDETVEQAILKMRQARHGCVQILDDDRPAGIFTERDAMSRVVRPGLDPRSTPIREVMTPRPNTSGVDEPPAYAIHRMVSRGFRHMPVTRDGKLVGSISVRNILRYLDREILEAQP